MNKIRGFVLVLAFGTSVTVAVAVSLSGQQPSTVAVAEARLGGQASAVGVKMTNADVIQLVSAGLSDQVVVASVRQATSVEFDLTPTGLVALKKGGVSNAVIASMQEKTPAPPPSTAQTPADSATGLVGLAHSIESGKEISLPVKYNSVCPNCPGTVRLFAMTPMIAAYMADGTVSMTKTSFSFKGTVGADFTISHDKILELDDQPAAASRIHVKILVTNKKNKEEKKDYYFYNVRARAIGDSTVGGPGQSIVCTGCDDSMHNFYKLLSSLRVR